MLRLKLNARKSLYIYIFSLRSQRALRLIFVICSAAGFHAKAADVLADSGRFHQRFDLVITAKVVKVLGVFFMDCEGQEVRQA